MEDPQLPPAGTEPSLPVGLNRQPRIGRPRGRSESVPGHPSGVHPEGLPAGKATNAPGPTMETDAGPSALGLVGPSPELARVRSLAVKAAAHDLPVLLLGESGTGKELVARAIHEESRRSAGPFVAVNCATLSRELASSELFGYVAGAFSGARKEGRDGHFRVAHKGTLFLDEVGELTPDVQALLLRALQEGEITPVGSSTPFVVDVRILASTNRRLTREVAEGRFRRDLFHRLDVLRVELPPLRQRPEDIRALAHHFMREMESLLDRPGIHLGPGVLDALLSWHWPGNVRELRNVIQRVVALESHGQVQVGDLPEEIQAAWRPLVEGECSQGSEKGEEGPPKSAGAEDAGVGQDRERARLRAAIRGSSTMKEAAARLGISRSTLYRWMRRHGLRPRRDVKLDQE